MRCLHCGHTIDENGFCYCDELPLLPKSITLIMSLCPDCGCLMDDLGVCEPCELELEEAA